LDTESSTSFLFDKPTGSNGIKMIFTGREKAQKPIKYDFPKEMLGINTIKYPKELRCFVSIFNLRTESKVCQFAIALPGPSTPEIKIYENIKKHLCTGNGSRYAQIEHIADIDFVKNLDNAWGTHAYWQKFADENEKNKKNQQLIKCKCRFQYFFDCGSFLQHPQFVFND
jgi:hypothetical protein